MLVLRLRCGQPTLSTAASPVLVRTGSTDGRLPRHRRPVDPAAPTPGRARRPGPAASVRQPGEGLPLVHARHRSDGLRPWPQPTSSPGSDDRTLTLSNLDKVLYPATGYTKAEVIAYYSQIAPMLLPYIADRALTRLRFPDGVGEQAFSFYEKNAPMGTPDWVRRAGRGHQRGSDRLRRGRRSTDRGLAGQPGRPGTARPAVDHRASACGQPTLRTAASPVLVRTGTTAAVCPAIAVPSTRSSHSRPSAATRAGTWVRQRAMASLSFTPATVVMDSDHGRRRRHHPGGRSHPDAVQPGQGALPGGRVHQGGGDRVLLADRPGAAAAHQRPGLDPAAVPGRGRRAGVLLLREERADGYAGLGPPGRRGHRRGADRLRRGR